MRDNTRFTWQENPCAEMTLPSFKDFDPSQKPQSSFVSRFVSNNTGLICLLSLLMFPIVMGFALGYLLVIMGVSTYRKIRGEKSRKEAAKEASQKIQVVLGDKVVDSCRPSTVSLNVQQSKDHLAANPRRKYYYHRLSSQSDGTPSRYAESHYDSASEDESDNRSRDDPDIDHSSSSTHASLEDNIDKTEDELEKETEHAGGKGQDVCEKQHSGSTKDKACNGEIKKEVTSVKQNKFNLDSENSLHGLKKSASPSEGQEKICTAILIEDDQPPSPILSEGKIGRLRFALHYNVARNELQVNIIKAVDLPVVNNQDGINSFLKICLLPQQFCWQRTKVIEGTCDPVFNETFIISGFSKERMKEYVLQFRVINYRDWFNDRYGDDVIGEIHFPLSELKMIDNRPSFSLTKWMNLQPVALLGVEPEKLGEICASLCFRPISGRLIITITRIRGLPKATDGRIDPYVKIALYCDGIRLSKANTRVKRRSTNPVYNEKFNFNVSADKISVTTVVLKVVNHYHVDSSAGNLGAVVLGFDSFGLGQEQWNSMIESPSRHTEKWHELCRDTSL